VDLIGKTCLLAVALLLIGSAALRAEPPAEPMYLGEARPKASVTRVVSLAPNLTEILFAISAGDRVVGVTRYDDHPPAVLSLPKVGGFLDPNLEAILGLKPDLVVCVPNSGNEKSMRTLIRLRIPVLVLPARKLEDVYSATTFLGDVLGQRDQARKINADMRKRAKAVTARVADRARPKVLIVYGHKPLVVAGPGTFADQLLVLAGGDNVVTSTKVAYPTLPLEMVIELAPEVIIDASMSGTGAEMRLDEVRDFWKRFKVIPAVRKDAVHLFDSALWFRPGPRLIDGLEHLERLLRTKRP
jgi:iron complex transport system substrate-binding protein